MNPRRPRVQFTRPVSGFVLAAISALAAPLAACRNEAAERAPRRVDAHDGDAHAGHDHDHGEGRPGAEIALTPEAIERYGVKLAQATAHTLKPTFVAPARVAFNAEAMAHVGSPLAGRVVDLPAKLGDLVRKGDVLIGVESPELGEAQSDFLQKRIMAQTSAAAVELSKNALDRATRLYEQNKGIALDELQKREVEYKSAQAALRTSQSAAVAAENRLHLLGMDQAGVGRLAETGEVNPRSAILAPLAGRVVERAVTLGELVSPATEALIVIADTTTLWVLADVPEARLAEVVVGADAWIRTGGTEDHKHAGQVSYISPMVDPRTRSAQVRIAAHCEHGALWPGMFVQAEIAVTDRANPEPRPIIAVPEGALQTVEGLPTVFVPVPDEPNTFAPRTVSVGKPVAGLVPIHSGLVEGEWVVTAGSFILKAELGKATAEHRH